MSQNSEPDRSFYAGVPDKKWQRLRDFRQNFPPHTLTIDRHTWTYYTGGLSAEPTLVIFHGGGGDAEAMFRYIDGFSENFHVIAPSIPPTVRTVEEAINGIHTILLNEGISRAHLFGVSFGGLLAQVYLRSFRETVASAVFSHTTSPAPHIAERVNMQRALVAFYPAALVRWLSKRNMTQAIERAPDHASDDERRFWQAYFTERYSTVIGKPNLLGRIRITADFHRNFSFRALDLNGWHGQILLIHSSHDEVITAGERGAIESMYPRAYVQVLEGYTHLAPVLCADDLMLSTTRFLLEEVPEVQP